MIYDITDISDMITQPVEEIKINILNYIDYEELYDTTFNLVLYMRKVNFCKNDIKNTIKRWRGGRRVFFDDI